LNVGLVKLSIGKENGMKYENFMIAMKIEPVRIKDSAFVLSDVGEVLYFQGKYDETTIFINEH
jgi:hypothetical protein